MPHSSHVCVRLQFSKSLILCQGPSGKCLQILLLQPLEWCFCKNTLQIGDLTLLSSTHVYLVKLNKYTVLLIGKY